MGPPRSKILCVDDEPAVLEGLELNLGRTFAMTTATSGAQGLDILARDSSFAVVVADMRMPQMDGAAFLGRVRKLIPEATRMLLTGHAETQAAIEAVNEGQVFRFLTKPCPAPQLMLAMKAAVAQHELVTSERVLLEQTLRGSIKTLFDMLALTSPAAFGRTQRIRDDVTALVAKAGVRDAWQVEIAAMVSQLGFIGLPPATMEKVYLGQDLTEEEQAMVARAPAITEQLLANIPRLDGVRAILAGQVNGPVAPAARAATDETIAQSIAILRIALDYERLEATGMSVARALDTMRGRHRYPGSLLEIFASLQGAAHKQVDVRELPLRSIAVGMVIDEDVRTHSGMLLVTRGYEVTAGFVERLRNYPAGTVKEPVRVLMGHGRGAA